MTRSKPLPIFLKNYSLAYNWLLLTIIQHACARGQFTRVGPSLSSVCTIDLCTGICMGPLVTSYNYAKCIRVYSSSTRENYIATCKLTYSYYMNLPTYHLKQKFRNTDSTGILYRGTASGHLEKKSMM